MLHPRQATLLLVALVAAVGMVDTGVAAVVEGGTGGHHHPPLLDCGAAPPLTPSKNADTAFRTNLSSALAALPSVAAAGPDAFAVVHVGRAFARGVCCRANVSSPAVASACNACLSAAAMDAIAGCGATSARAGVWRAECFLSYADSDVLTPREKMFRGWFYVGKGTPVALDGGECLRDSAVDCGRCLHDSARAVAAALGWLQRIHGEEVLVVGYSCFLHVKISSLPRGSDGGGFGAFAFNSWMGWLFALAAWIVGLSFYSIIKIVRALPQVNG